MPTARSSGGSTTCRCVSTRLRSSGHDAAPVGPQEPGDRAQHGGLAGAGRADERQRLAAQREAHVQLEAPQAVAQLDGQRVVRGPRHTTLHCSRILVAMRMTKLTATSSADIASADSKLVAENSA